MIVHGPSLHTLEAPDALAEQAPDAGARAATGWRAASRRDGRPVRGRSWSFAGTLALRPPMPGGAAETILEIEDFRFSVDEEGAWEWRLDYRMPFWGARWVVWTLDLTFISACRVSIVRFDGSTPRGWGARPGLSAATRPSPSTSTSMAPMSPWPARLRAIQVVDHQRHTSLRSGIGESLRDHFDRLHFLRPAIDAVFRVESIAG